MFSKLYARAKYSKLAELYRLARYKTYRESLNHETELLRPLIKTGALVFDIGANSGQKTHVFLRMGATRVVAVEPTHELVAFLHSRFGSDRRVSVVEKAIDSTSGLRKLNVSRQSDAFNTLSDKWVDSMQDSDTSRFSSLVTYDCVAKVEATTLDQLCDNYGIPDAIKLDVEGYELNALNGLTRGIGLVWFEANLPEFAQESVLCVDRLNSIDTNYRFNFSKNTTESPLAKFELENWAKGIEMMKLIESAEFRFMEIFARLA